MKALIKTAFNFSKVFIAFTVIAKNEYIISFFALLIKSVKSMMIWKNFLIKLSIKSCKSQEYENILHRLKLRSVSDYVNTRLLHLNISSSYYKFQKNNFFMIKLITLSWVLKFESSTRLEKYQVKLKFFWKSIKLN